MAETRQYELIYVIAPDVSDEGVSDVHTEVERIVSASGGQIEKTDNWGRRRLAYEINRHREGTYVLELLSAPGEVVDELERRLKVNDTVLRYLVVRVDEDLRKAERTRSERQVRRQRRRGSRSSVPTPAPAAAVGETGESGSTGSPTPAVPAGVVAESPSTTASVAATAETNPLSGSEIPASEGPAGAATESGEEAEVKE